MLKVTAKLLAPVTVPDTQPVGNRVGTLPYIPGTTFRGALAAAWINKNGIPNSTNPKYDEFVQLFESEFVYGSLLPVGASFEPVSIMRCKYPHDVKTKDGKRCDSYLPDRADRETTPEDLAGCKICGGPLENGKGGLHHAWGDLTQDITRTQLDENETADEGQLYTTGAIRAGTILEGFIRAEHPWFSQIETVFIGRRKTVAGKVQLSFETVENHKPTSKNDTLVLRLKSPAIVVNEWGLADLDFDLNQISEVLGCHPEDLGFDSSNSWIRPTHIGGWHAASGLPKPDEVAIGIGSTIRLEPKVTISDEALAKLAHHGMGLRRNEGFGSLEVNPPTWTKPEPETTNTTSVEQESTRTLDTAWVRELSTSDAKELISLLRNLNANPQAKVAFPQRRLRELPSSLRVKITETLNSDSEERSAILKALRYERGGIR